MADSTQRFDDEPTRVNDTTRTEAIPTTGREKPSNGQQAPETLELPRGRGRRNWFKPHGKISGPRVAIAAVGAAAVLGGGAFLVTRDDSPTFPDTDGIPGDCTLDEERATSITTQAFLNDPASAETVATREIDLRGEDCPAGVTADAYDTLDATLADLQASGAAVTTTTEEIEVTSTVPAETTTTAVTDSILPPVTGGADIEADYTIYCDGKEIAYDPAAPPQVPNMPAKYQPGQPCGIYPGQYEVHDMNGVTVEILGL